MGSKLLAVRGSLGRPVNGSMAGSAWVKWELVEDHEQEEVLSFDLSFDLCQEAGGEGEEGGAGVDGDGAADNGTLFFCIFDKDEEEVKTTWEIVDDDEDEDEQEVVSIDLGQEQAIAVDTAAVWEEALVATSKAAEAAQSTEWGPEQAHRGSRRSRAAAKSRR